MVVPPNGGPASNAGPANSTKMKNPSSKSSTVPAPLSARRAEPLDLRTVERKGKPLPGTPRDNAPRQHEAGILEAPTFRPTVEEWSNPLDYIQSIHPKASKYGIVKVVPPAGWNPDFAIDLERFHFKTRRQELNSVEGGNRANLNYLDQLQRFHKSNGVNLTRFPSVDKRPLDLYELKKAVESRGGFERVCKGKKWAEIGRDLGYSGKIMSSLSTSLKNSYQKWLEPYESYLKVQKGPVLLDAEQRRGGPYATPSPAGSPASKTPLSSTQNNVKENGTVKASQALHESLRNASPVEDFPPSGSGFTAVNAPPSGFTAVNAPNGHVKSEGPVAEAVASKDSGATSSSPPLNGTGHALLKRRLSDASNANSENDASVLERRSKRAKRETPNTVSGSHMMQPKSAGRSAVVRDRPNDKPGEICEQCGKGEDDQNILICEACYQGYHTYCLDPVLTEIPDHDWHCPRCLVGTGEFGFEDGGVYSLKAFQEKANFFKKSHFASRVPFDPATNGPRAVTENEVEREFWRLVSSLTETVEVEYGADIHSTTHGSGFPTIERNPRSQYSIDPWNLNNLPLHQDSLFRFIKSDISGMTVPWLYVGMCFSTFCWHNEDHYTYSANYQHLGATKTWYGIPGKDAEAFEDAMKKAVPDLFESQPDLLFQLVTLLPPDQLTKAGVHLYAVDQRAGEFVITFPQAYHAGFNHGFNFNEAVNFAPHDWEPSGQSGVDRLREFRRQPCFSHDALLLTAAAGKDVAIRTAKWLAPALQRILDREKWYRQFFEDRVMDKKYFKPREDDALLLKFERLTEIEDIPEDEYICHYCKAYAYLSRFVCDNAKKVSCLDHVANMNCCESREGHTLAYRMTTTRLEQSAQRVAEKAKLPDIWKEKFEAAVVDTPKPQFKILKSLLQEGERIPWELPELANLKAFVDKCQEWIEEATNYITRKQQNRRKNEKVWRKGSQAKFADVEERDKDSRKLENIKKLLTEAEQIGFDCPEIATLQERADAITSFQSDAQVALENISKQTTQQVEDLIEVGRSFAVEIPELDHLDKIAKQMRWLDRAKDRSEQKTLREVTDLIEQAHELNVPEQNEQLLYLKEQKTEGERWETNAKQLMANENVQFSQLDSFAKQAANLPVSKETLAQIDSILKKQREAQDKILTLYEMSKQDDFYQRPKYKEVQQIMEDLKYLNSKPTGTIDLEKELRRHEDWMRRGKKLFGKSNAPLHILLQHLELVEDRNRYCFDLRDQPRMPVEPSSRDHSPDPNARASSEGAPRDVFCLCRTPEAGTMIECSVCHEWYHSKCLKIARGKIKLDEDFTCPICDWRVKIPRDAARPKIEELIAWQDEMPYLPFQPDEFVCLNNIVETAMTFRQEMEKFISPSPMGPTMAEVPIHRFYLRKLEGADILLGDETNFFRQDLHRQVPIAPEPPPFIEVSHSTRKPRPTKQQKLMAQLGIDNPDDLPQHLRTKPYNHKKRQQQDDAKQKPVPGNTGLTPGKPGHTNTRHTLNFRPPLTANAFPSRQQGRVSTDSHSISQGQNHSQQSSRADSPLFGSAGPNAYPSSSAPMPGLGSPFGTGVTASSPPPGNDAMIDPTLFNSSVLDDSPQGPRDSRHDNHGASRVDTVDDPGALSNEGHDQSNLGADYDIYGNPPGSSSQQSAGANFESMFDAYTNDEGDVEVSAADDNSGAAKATAEAGMRLLHEEPGPE